MQIDKERLEEVKRVGFSHGYHKSKAEGMCVMEAAAYIAGENWGDKAECVCPVIGAFLRRYHDGLETDKERNEILMQFPEIIVGTRSSPAVEQRRAYLCADYSVRVFAPLALGRAGLEKQAEKLRALSQIVDTASARAGADAADAADTAVSSAWAAAAFAGADAAADAADAARYGARAAAGAADADAFAGAARAAADAARAEDSEKVVELIHALINMK